jgi:5-methyltetrahydropteroyltriglutamate--homocysteine methyltransferase
LTLILSSTGSFPRVGDTPELQILRRTILLMDRGERTIADLADAENEMTRRAIEDQAGAGVELFTDGLVRWYDPVSHIAGKLEGVKIAGLLRYFDTNFYFRQPVLTSRPRRRGPILTEEFQFARNALGQLPTHSEKAGRLSIKAVMTGPYTLARLSVAEDETMQPLEARVEAYAEALGAEVTALADAGAEFIQVDEPAILKHPEDWKIFEAAVHVLAKARMEANRGGRRPQLALCVYFGDAAPLYRRLSMLGVDVLGLDFTYNPKFFDQVAEEGAPLPLALGLLDGRNTKLEDPEMVARQVERVLHRVGGARVYLGPSCGLEYLPRDCAVAKLQLLPRIRAAVRGGA